MYPVFKRLLDLTFSLLGILILFPVFIIIIVLVWIYHGRPVFFSQKRPGKNEQIFKMYKFRTMNNEKDLNGNFLPDEKRITKFGSLLRKTSLDELPELINVVKGDMSLIGPRPLLIKYLPYYTEREHKRHLVRPGLTGLAQVSGRNTLNWENRLESDVKYVENIGFFLDLKILFKTFATLFRSNENIGLNIMEDFDTYRRNIQKTKDDRKSEISGYVH